MWYWRYNAFSLSRDLARPCDQRVEWLYRQDPIEVSFHPAKFGGHRHSGRGNIMVFVCHVTNAFSLSRDLARPSDQRVKWLYRQEPIEVSYHPAKFGGHRHSGRGDITVFVCHVTLQDHVVKALNLFMIMSPSRKVTIRPRLVAMGTMVVEI